MHYMYSNNYTAELRRSFAKALVLKAQRPEECSTVKVGCFLRRLAKAPYYEGVERDSFCYVFSTRATLYPTGLSA